MSKSHSQPNFFAALVLALSCALFLTACGTWEMKSPDSEAEPIGGGAEAPGGAELGASEEGDPAAGAAESGDDAAGQSDASEEAEAPPDIVSKASAEGAGSGGLEGAPTDVAEAGLTDSSAGGDDAVSQPEAAAASDTGAVIQPAAADDAQEAADTGSETAAGAQEATAPDAEAAAAEGAESDSSEEGAPAAGAAESGDGAVNQSEAPEKADTAGGAAEAQAEDADSAALTAEEEALIQEGEQIFSSAAAACFVCHSVTAESQQNNLGPPLAGVYQEKGGDYVRESITNPAAVIAEGYQPVMPALNLPENSVDALVAYIKSLKK